MPRKVKKTQESAPEEQVPTEITWIKNEITGTYHSDLFAIAKIPNFRMNTPRDEYALHWVNPTTNLYNPDQSIHVGTLRSCKWMANDLNKLQLETKRTLAMGVVGKPVNTAPGTKEPSSYEVWSGHPYSVWRLPGQGIQEGLCELCELRRALFTEGKHEVLKTGTYDECQQLAAKLYEEDQLAEKPATEQPKQEAEFKLPTIEQVIFKIECRPETMPYVGNCSAIDPETDRRTEEWIRKELADGNTWAWCMMEVTASYGGAYGSDFLGGCSYKSQKDFEKCAYYEDMKKEAYESLCEVLQETKGMSDDDLVQQYGPQDSEGELSCGSSSSLAGLAGMAVPSKSPSRCDICGDQCPAENLQQAYEEPGTGTSVILACPKCIHKPM